MDEFMKRLEDFENKKNVVVNMLVMVVSKMKRKFKKLKIDVTDCFRVASKDSIGDVNYDGVTDRKDVLMAYAQIYDMEHQIFGKCKFTSIVHPVFKLILHAHKQGSEENADTVMHEILQEDQGSFNSDEQPLIRSERIASIVKEPQG